jgi:hypothetical protein
MQGFFQESIGHIEHFKDLVETGIQLGYGRIYLRCSSVVRYWRLSLVRMDRNST